MNTLIITSACRDNTTDVGRIRPLWDPHHNQACYGPSRCTAETDRLLCDMYDYASRSAAEIVVVVIIIIIIK